VCGLPIFRLASPRAGQPEMGDLDKEIPRFATEHAEGDPTSTLRAVPPRTSSSGIAGCLRCRSARPQYREEVLGSLEWAGNWHSGQETGQHPPNSPRKVGGAEPWGDSHDSQGFPIPAQAPTIFTQNAGWAGLRISKERTGASRGTGHLSAWGGTSKNRRGFPEGFPGPPDCKGLRIS
jgi:hypothetical protein